MDWLIWVFFESLPALGAVLFVVLFGLLAHWRRSRRGLPLLIGIGVAIALLITQKVVVTQREHAKLILDPIERELERGQAGALAAALAPEFDAEGYDRDAFIDLVRNRLGRVNIKYVNRWSMQTEDSQPDRFTAVVVYNSDVLIEGMRQPLTSTWAITFVRAPTGWKIRQIRCRQLPGHTNPTLSDIHGM
jgi:hypothetical protein